MESDKKKKMVFSILAGLGLYLLSAGISYAGFKYLNKDGSSSPISPLGTEEGRAQLNLDAPKTEECPLNGEMFTRTEKAIWEKKRPLGIMVENHLDSRPQSGLAGADVVYEAVAEGGITRFLAVFYCRAAAKDVLVGPVRSARTYFLDWISEYADYPLYAHVGGANLPGKANALGQVGDYGWLAMGNDLNQFSLGYPTFWRDYERLGRPVATEHTMYSKTDRLWEAAEKRGLTQTDEDGNRWDEEFTPWKFEDAAEEKGSVAKISLSFWDYADYDVRWDYDRETNVYRRSNGGQSHQDLNSGHQMTASVVIVQFSRETGPIDELKHLLYQTIGTGEAIIFQNGQVIEGSWAKESRTERTIFYNEQKKEVAFSRG